MKKFVSLVVAILIVSTSSSSFSESFELISKPPAVPDIVLPVPDGFNLNTNDIVLDVVENYCGNFLVVYVSGAWRTGYTLFVEDIDGTVFFEGPTANWEYYESDNTIVAKRSWSEDDCIAFNVEQMGVPNDYANVCGIFADNDQQPYVIVSGRRCGQDFTNVLDKYGYCIVSISSHCDPYYFTMGYLVFWVYEGKNVPLEAMWKNINIHSTDYQGYLRIDLKTLIGSAESLADIDVDVDVGDFPDWLLEEEEEEECPVIPVIIIGK